VKARNEYILCLEAANAAVQKYFSDDIHDLINVCIVHLKWKSIGIMPLFRPLEPIALTIVNLKYKD